MSRFEDVLAWLGRLRLEQYGVAFEAQGYDDMEDLLEMTPAEVEVMIGDTAMKKRHADRLREWSALRRAKAGLTAAQFGVLEAALPIPGDARRHSFLCALGAFGLARKAELANSLAAADDALRDDLLAAVLEHEDDGQQGGLPVVAAAAAAAACPAAVAAPVPPAAVPATADGGGADTPSSDEDEPAAAAAAAAAAVEEEAELPEEEPVGEALDNRGVLEALFARTNGAGWLKRDGWLEAGRDLGSWHGVTVENGEVVELNLESNHLEGQLPAALGQLRGLRELRLCFNELTGRVPAAIGGCVSLRTLYINNNALRGPLPAALGDCRQLEVLSVWSNRLSGELPTAALGQLKSLKSLLANGNRFEAWEAAAEELAQLLPSTEILLDDTPVADCKTQ